MKEKTMREWFLDVPWGKLAMVSWGEQWQPPVLMVHGYVDSAATFYPLVRLLPDTFYYLAFDLPGHGKSDVPPGPPVTYLHFADVIRQIVEQLGWDTFICIAHSMGYIISSFYNAAFPGRITKMVNLDGVVGLGPYMMPTGDVYPPWFEHCFDRYYRNYSPAPKPISYYTYDDAIALLAKARDITNEQAAILATRCLAPVGDGMYRFSWDPKVKKIGSMLFTFDSLYAILAKNTPTLNVIATDNNNVMFINREIFMKMMEKLHRETTDYFILNVKGGHDVHFTNPESFVEDVKEFLNSEFGAKSKL